MSLSDFKNVFIFITNKSLNNGALVVILVNISIF